MQTVEFITNSMDLKRQKEESEHQCAKRSTSAEEKCALRKVNTYKMK